MPENAAFLHLITRLYSLYQSFDLVIDSRMVGEPEKTLFFALPGERRDGHEFIPLLIRLGVRHFVVEGEGAGRQADAINAAVQEVEGSAPSFTRVRDPLEVLQQLAAFHRQQFSIPVVAVTGSNGKTIVKNWLRELLSLDRDVCASPRSYNSRIGVPLSVWRMRARHAIAVLEVGISQPGDMDLLRFIVRPTHGVLTTIGTAHVSQFASQEALAKEKLSLFRDCLAVVIRQNEKYYALAQEMLGEGRLVPWFGIGTSGLLVAGKTFALDYPELPAVYLDNARAATATASLFDPDWKGIREAVRHFVVSGNRLEQRSGRDGNIVINDTYSNDISALGAALEFAETQDPYGSITLILGHVQEVDGLERRLAALLRQRISRLILVGDRHASLRGEFPHLRVFASVADLARTLPELSFQNQTVLVKGASYQGMDQIADMLSRQLHRTVLSVNLTALRHNFRTYQRSLPKDCAIVVMAKASAYGSGALPVARLLEDIGAAYLAVAYPEEGRELRRGGIRLPIMVLNAEAYSYPMLAEYELEPVVHRAEELRFASRLGLPSHLELDTGMARLGFLEEKFFELLERDTELASAKVASIFTHLAASESKDHDAFTRQQLATFDRLYAAYRSIGGADVKRHALNTNGISRFPAAAYDMVRLGIGLYGIGDSARESQLMPALTLTTTVTAISQRKAGETVGYGRRGLLANYTRLAVLSIGYADGLPRLAGEGRFGVRIHNHLAPTVGCICMDMCTVDITGIEGVRVGDVAVVFGPEHPIEILAAAARTIPYEILTGIGPRVHRVYVGE